MPPDEGQWTDSGHSTPELQATHPSLNLSGSAGTHNGGHLAPAAFLSTQPGRMTHAQCGTSTVLMGCWDSTRWLGVSSSCPLWACAQRYCSLGPWPHALTRRCLAASRIQRILSKYCSFTDGLTAGCGESRRGSCAIAAPTLPPRGPDLALEPCLGPSTHPIPCQPY